MDELIRKNLEFKADNVDLEEGTFTGHASTFGNVDSQGDIVEKGAFTKTLKEAGRRVKILFEHSKLIGKPLEMSEDDKGLKVKGKISKTTLGSDILTLMRDGALDEMSIGFQIVKSEPDKKNVAIRRIKEVKLWEFSLVPWGANDQALVTGVKKMTFEYKTALGDRLRSLMDSNDVSVSQMASAAGISESTVGQILNGTIARPPDRRLRGFARVLGVSFQSLLRLIPADIREIQVDEIFWKALIEDEPPCNDRVDPELVQSVRGEVKELSNLLSEG